MDLTLSGLAQAAIRTIREPRSVARAVLSLDLTRQERWQMLLLTVVLSAILAKASALVAGDRAAETGIFAASPFTLGFIQLVVMLFAVFAVHHIGRRFGGEGDLGGAIVLMAWLQFVMICLQIVQIFAMMVSPALAFLLGLAGLILFFWMLTQFIMELHGFKSGMAVFLGISLSMVGFAVLLSILLGVSGVAVPGVSDV